MARDRALGGIRIARRAMGKKQNFLARPPPPPDQNFRKKPGNFKAKLDKKENKEVESAAIARKQEPLPIKKVLLGLAAWFLAWAPW